MPFGPWEPDKASVNAAHIQTALNVLPRADGYGPWKNPQAFASPLAAGNDTYTKVLLHFNGADAATTITDNNAGGSSHTWTVAGNAQIDTAQSKFGGAACLFDGTGDWVTTADHADYALGSSDFTIDYWIRPGAATDGTDLIHCGQMDSAATASTASFFIRRFTTNKIVASISDGSYTTLTSTTSLLASTWAHVAVVRSGNVLTLYINGTSEATAAFTGSVPDSTFALRVGAGGEFTSNPMNGWIEEFRLSVGIARWTTNFTAPGKQYANPTTQGVCRGFFVGRNSDGTVSIFAAKSDASTTDDGVARIYQLRATDLDWVDVSSAGTGYTALPTGYHFQFGQFGSLVLAVQPNIVPQTFTLGSSTAFATLSGSPPQAAFISIVNRFVVLSGLTSTPFRIKWSGLGDATMWTVGTNSSDQQDLPDGGLVRGVAGGEYGVVFQENVIRRMIYQPGDTRVFVFEKVTEDKGLLAPYSIVKAGTQILFLAQQGFHAMGATGVPAPIGKEKFDRYFFSNVDQSQLQLIIGSSDPEAPRCYWAFKAQSGQSGFFNQIICYDLALDRATLCTAVTGEYIAPLAAPGATLENMDTINPSLDALTFSLDDVALSALPKLAIFTSSHALSFFSGPNMEATVDTSEQELDGGRRMRIRGFRPLIDATTCYGSVGGRETLQSSVSYSTEQAVNSLGRCPANVSTRLARGRVRVPSATVWTAITGLEPDVVPDGLR